MLDIYSTTRSNMLPQILLSFSSCQSNIQIELYIDRREGFQSAPHSCCVIFMKQIWNPFEDANKTNLPL